MTTGHAPVGAALQYYSGFVDQLKLMEQPKNAWPGFPRAQWPIIRNHTDPTDVLKPEVYSTGDPAWFSPDEGGERFRSSVRNGCSGDVDRALGFASSLLPSASLSRPRRCRLRQVRWAMFRLDGLTSRRGFASAAGKWWLLLGLFALLLWTASLASAQYSDQDEPQHGGVTSGTRTANTRSNSSSTTRTPPSISRTTRCPYRRRAPREHVSVTRDGATQTADLVPSGKTA